MAVAEATLAAAGAVLLYLVLCGRVPEEEEEEEKESGERGSDSVVVESRGSGKRWSRKRRMRMYTRRPTEPPATWVGKTALVASTVRLTYSETMGRWPLTDLFFGIRHHMRRQVSCSLGGGIDELCRLFLRSSDRGIYYLPFPLASMLIKVGFYFCLLLF